MAVDAIKVSENVADISQIGCKMASSFMSKKNLMMSQKYLLDFMCDVNVSDRLLFTQMPYTISTCPIIF